MLRYLVLYVAGALRANLLIIFFSFAIGGSLGWKTKGSLDPTFEEVAFALQPSTTGNPIIGEAKTPFGYHIIMVSLQNSTHVRFRSIQWC